VLGQFKKHNRTVVWKMAQTLSFGSKAETLNILRPQVMASQILPQYDFTVSQWHSMGQSIIQQITHSFHPNPVIVRSSAKGEDGWDQSNAGKYESVLDVDTNDSNALSHAVQIVVNAFHGNPNDQILVQPMLKNISYCGVVFTRDLNTFAPYYTFNYDQSGSTDSITSGRQGTYTTLVHCRFAPFEISDPQINNVLKAVQELETLCNSDRLDIEFAVTTDGTVYILQVRPIAMQSTDILPDDHTIRQHLQNIYNCIHERNRPHPFLKGQQAIFGVMPDWNPAEIIGIKPRQLALTLYKELITDSIWAYQRDNYGYRNLRSFPLLIDFAGMPYIDVRVDFNSFIPKDLDEGLAEKLATYYLDKLIASPDSHDKVEFDIVFSCYTLDLPTRLEALLNEGFTFWELGELRSSLRRLTNEIIAPNTGLFQTDKSKIDKLTKRQDTVLTSDLTDIEKIYWLVEDCKRYGTLPFAGIARAAFIAVQFLRSFQNAGIMTKDEHDRFMRSINTVSKKLSSDLQALRQQNLSRAEFLQRYGHLRPGTYDILSKRYDEAFEAYFDLSSDSNDSPNAVSDLPFEFTPCQLSQIDQYLQEQGIAISANGLIEFIRDTIESREYAKIVFTKSLSEVLKLLSQVGKDLELDDDDLSHLDITTILKTQASVALPNFKDVLTKNILEAKTNYRYTQQLKMPALICSPNNIYSFYLEDGTPNYVTSGRVTGDVVAKTTTQDQCFKGKIVMIENADPGYDWLFAHNIGGLITMYGGTNSHMAIRTAELGIPAVIGCGEKYYNMWRHAESIEINAANKQVVILK